MLAPESREKPSKRWLYYDLRGRKRPTLLFFAVTGGKSNTEGFAADCLHRQQIRLSSPETGHPISPPMNSPEIPQQSWAFPELRPYLRLPCCRDFGLETAFFSKASYFAFLVWFGKFNGQSDNLQGSCLEFELVSVVRERQSSHWTDLVRRC